MGLVPHARLRQAGSLLKEKLIFDGRNLYDLDEMKRLGFGYVSVGRDRVNVKATANA